LGGGSGEEFDTNSRLGNKKMEKNAKKNVRKGIL